MLIAEIIHKFCAMYFGPPNQRASVLECGAAPPLSTGGWRWNPRFMERDAVDFRGCSHKERPPCSYLTKHIKHLQAMRYCPKTRSGCIRVFALPVFAIAGLAGAFAAPAW